MKLTKEQIPLWQFAYTSEWALAKFFSVIFNKDLNNFNLLGISGRANNKDEVRNRLLEEISKRTQNILHGKKWRMDNTITEIESSLEILKKLKNNELDYYSVNGNISPENLPQQDFLAAAVHTANPLHLRYIQSLVERGKHILCEKPLIVLTDENHQADNRELNKLEELIEKYKDSGIVMMDAEHYSAKIAARTFFENLPKMIGKYGRISRIEGHTYEKDDPEKERTRKMLCRNNRTGLLLDMGVHLFGLITNIEGNIGKISHAEYDIYPGHKNETRENCKPYDVETYVKTNFSLEGHLFQDNAQGEFTFAKFIDRFSNPITEDNKTVYITFTKKSKTNEDIDTLVTLDIAKGIVKDNHGQNYHSSSSKEEYVNILQDFHNAIIEKNQPRTSFEHSLKNLDAIYRTYRDFPVNDKDNLVERYAR